MEEREKPIKNKLPITSSTRDGGNYPKGQHGNAVPERIEAEAGLMPLLLLLYCGGLDAAQSSRRLILLENTFTGKQYPPAPAYA